MTAVLPASTVTKALASIGSAKPITASLKKLGCKIIEMEVEAKDAFAGRNDGYRVTVNIHNMRKQYTDVHHRRCRNRLQYALTELRALINAVKEQTNG